MKVVILDPSTGHRPHDIGTLRGALENGIAKVPIFHRVLVPTPFKVGHPSWAYRRELDLDYHIRRAAVPSPGGRREFAEVVSEIASTGLERDRPLWQLWIVEGLEGGRIAYVTKLHHAIADGGSSAQVLLELFQRSPEERYQEAPHPEGTDEPIPDPWPRIRDGMRDTLALVRRSLNLGGRSLRLGWLALKRRIRGKPRPAVLYSAPPTRFNRPLSPHRWFATVDLPLPELKRIKDTLGGTLNDVYVALCSGAIRRYLAARDELPGQPLVASVPVSIRKPEERLDYGNRLSNWIVSLETHREDPLERYLAIREKTAAARANQEEGDPEFLNDVMDAWWAYRVLMGVQKLGRWSTGRPEIHAIVSNVRGPSETLYADGARVTGLQSMGPLVDGCGLNFTGWSYVDVMHVGIVVCREHVPDVWELCDGMEAELEELRVVAEKERTRAASTG